MYGRVYRKNISDGLESQSPRAVLSPFSLGERALYVCVRRSELSNECAVRQEVG